MSVYVHVYIFVGSVRHTDIQTYRHTDIHPDRHPDRQTDRQDRQTDRQTDIRTDIHAYRQTDMTHRQDRHT